MSAPVVFPAPPPSRAARSDLRTGWAPALRVARRESRRGKGRSALIAALIALPVAALAYAAVSYDMFQLTPTESYQRLGGAADAVVQFAPGAPVRQDPTSLTMSEVTVDQPGARPHTEEVLRGLLPAGSRLVVDRSFSVLARAATRSVELTSRALDGSDPMTRGIFTIRRGHAPRGSGEVALSERAIAATGVAPGGTLRLSDGSRYRVVGVVEFPANLRETALFDGAHPPTDPAGSGADEPNWLVATPAPLTWAYVRQLNLQGVLALSREVVGHPPSAADAGVTGRSTDVTASDVSLLVIVAGLAGLEIVLLAGPAFAVGARRRSRDLAVLAANGANAAHLRRVVLADGVVLGALGTAAGLGVGVGAAFAGRGPLADHVAFARPGAYRVFPLALAGIVIFALVTAVLAATVPAFVAARQDVVAALAGRRGVTRSRKRWLVLGLALTALGTAVATAGARAASSNLVLTGLATGEIGLVLCTPALVGLISRAARLLPLAPRIALRDTARNRGASAPAISAVMAAVAGTVAIGVYAVSGDLRDRATYQPEIPPGYAIVRVGSGPGAKPPPVDAISRLLRTGLPTRAVSRVTGIACATDPNGSCGLRAAMPSDRVCPYDETARNRSLTAAEQRSAAHDPRCADGPGVGDGGPTYVDDGTSLAALTGASGEEVNRATRTLRSGGVVVLRPELVRNNQVTLEVYNDSDGSLKPTAALSAPAYVLRGSAVGRATIVPPAIVARAGLAQHLDGVVAVTSRTPTADETQRVTDALSLLKPAYTVQVEQPSDHHLNLILYILGIAGAVITIGAAAIATGLAAADSRPDLATLAAVGASPGLRRRLSLSQTGVIAGLGSLMGAAAGLGAAVAVLVALNSRYDQSWPAPPPYPITVPWLNLGLAVVVVPLVAMAGAGLLTRSRLPVERRL
ncbi:MAG: putative transport system permease protein [Micromonosporaceae bacterium]|nr:putative transport system permease protein [Micromonosporaceae bacterium]